MKVILIGAPGSGKGTQAKLLSERLGVPHISTGDILRQNVREGTELGRKASPIMEAGGLVPDDLMVSMIAERLKSGDVAGGFILDGFPRTVAQAEKLDTLLRADANGNGMKDLRVVHFSVPDEAIVSRITGRRSCQKCGAVYHIENNPPKVAGTCDLCGATLVSRPDDTEVAVRKRLDAYREQTVPVLDHYREQNVLRDVDGYGPVDEVFERVEKSLR
ncbi:MAG: adenylate kinase [Thermoanaerobaculia bacterium]